MLLMVICGTTNTLLALLGIPFTVTRSGPVVAEVGTVVTIWLSLQLVAVAAKPLNVTVLLRWLAWKPDPLMVICVPTTPPAGDIEFTEGGGTVNTTELLLGAPLTVTMAGPLVEVTGTVATICPSFQLETEAVCPLKLRLLVPCVLPTLFRSHLRAYRPNS